MQNVVSLLVISAANYILPLITMPYLARILQPAGWGQVLFAQGYALWLAVVIEYGFVYSATREIARRANSPEALVITVNAVNGAKILLTLAATVITVITWMISPSFQRSPGYLLWAWLTAIFQGLYPMWYFQGVQRIRRLALLSTATRTLATVLTFLLVRTSLDGWVILALQTAAAAVATTIALFWMYKEVPLRRPIRRDVVRVLGTGKYMFTVTLAAGIYGQAGTFLVGLLSNPVQVGFYGGAERINRIMTNLFAVLGQALYPHMSQTAHTDFHRSRRLARALFLGSTIIGIALAILTVISAPWLVQLLLGPGFEPAVLVLQVMALQITLTGMSRVLGTLWMLPLEMDRSYNRIVVAAGMINLALTALLVPMLQAPGMAIAFVLTELFVTGALGWFVQRSGHAFWHRNCRCLENA